VVGHRTRLFTFLNWLMVCSLQNRNYVVCHSGDTVQRVMLFWAIFLPLGEYLSVDAALKKHPHSSRQKDVNSNGSAEVLGVGAIAFTFQILVMYITAHFHKSAPEWRELGIATWMALQLDFFRTWVGDIFVYFPWFCKQLTFGVLIWQKWGTIIYFVPFYNKYLKAISVLGYLAMHLGFGMCLRLEQFTWVTEAALTGLIPGWVWDESIKYFSNKQKKSVQIQYLQRCRFCTVFAKLSGEFMLPRTKIIPINTLPHTKQQFEFGKEEHTHQSGCFGVVFVDEHKVTHTGSDMLVALTKASPILYPLHYLFKIKPVRTIGNALSQLFHCHQPSAPDLEQAVSVVEEPVDFSAASSSTISTTATPAEGDTHPQTIPSDDFPPQKPKIFKRQTFEDKSSNWEIFKETIPIAGYLGVQALLGFLLFLVLTWNAGNIQFHDYSTPYSLRGVLFVTQLDQYWGMFAPRPPDVMWWYNIEAELDDGTKAELFNNGAMFTFQPNVPHTYDKPRSVHESMGNHRWFKLFENGLNSHEAREDLRLNFGRWLCREYNARHSGGERLYKYTIYWMNERVDLQKMDGTRYPGGKQTIWNHLCYEKPRQE